MTKQLTVAVAVCAAMALFADEAATNAAAAAANAGGDDFLQSVVQYAKDGIPEVRGNALWDLIKFVLSCGLKIIPLACVFFVVVVSLFSQRLHVRWFIKGRWRSAFKFSTDDSFGWLVRRPNARAYFRIKSRTDEITGKNDKNGESNGINNYGSVSLVMGPAGAGKKLLVYAESDARYIIAVPCDQWYDDTGKSPVKSILKERARLLVQHLLWKKRVCVVLEWDLTHELPSTDRMNMILQQLTEIVSDRDDEANAKKQRAFRMVSFVLAVPAYYLPLKLHGNQQEIQNDYVVNLLNCTECRTLFDEKVKSTEGLAQCKEKVESKAKDIGISLDRMIWVESFGRPKQVLEILEKEKYDSVEAWVSLCGWWRQVYATENVNDEKTDWFAYLYMLALHGQMQNGPVDAEAILKGMFKDEPDRQRNMRNALLKICAKAKGYNLRDLDTLLVFDEPYVRDRFILSLGAMDDGQGGNIFNFMDEMRPAVEAAFDLGDVSVCRNLASMYLGLAGASPNLAKQLSDQYAFAAMLTGTKLGGGSLAAEYGRQLRDPIFMRVFVEKVISRIGALNIAHCIELFKSINETLLKNNSAGEYVNLAFEMLPAYAIAKFLPTGWGVDFATVIDEFGRSDAADEVRFKCAVFIASAHLQIDCFKGSLTEEIKNLSAQIKSAYQRVREYVEQNRGKEYWDCLYGILPIAESGMSIPELPSLDFATMPQAVRTAWLSMLYHTLVVHSSRTDSAESVAFTARVNDVLCRAEMVGYVDRLIAHACIAMIPFWYDLATEAGTEALRKDILSLLQCLGRWSECPAIARSHFQSLCTECIDAILKGKAELVPHNVLWEMLMKLREWQNGMCDCEYSWALQDFAAFLRNISASGVEIDLRSAWKEFAELVKGFWKPILVRGKLDDLAMSAFYFGMYSCLSNTEVIPKEWRRELMQEIALNWPVLCTGAGAYEVTALNLSQCNPTLLTPGTKLYWIAHIYSGKTVSGGGNDEAGRIAAAEMLLEDARANGTRKVDEGLVAKLHEEIGKV